MVLRLDEGAKTLPGGGRALMAAIRVAAVVAELTLEPSMLPWMTCGKRLPNATLS